MSCPGGQGLGVGRAGEMKGKGSRLGTLAAPPFTLSQKLDSDADFSNSAQTQGLWGNHRPHS